MIRVHRARICLLLLSGGAWLFIFIIYFYKSCNRPAPKRSELAQLDEDPGERSHLSRTHALHRYEDNRKKSTSYTEKYIYRPFWLPTSKAKFKPS